jgi:hypothetical protein
MNVGSTGLGRTRLPPRGSLSADCRRLVSIEARRSCERLIPVGCCTQWVLSPPPRARHAEQLGVELPVPIRVPEYRLRHGHSQTDGCWRDASSRQWDACGPTERLVPRWVVVGNLGYDVSFTLPQSPTRCCRPSPTPTPPPWRPSTPRRWGAPSAGWSASPSAARRSRRRSPTWVRPRGGVPGGAAGGRAAHPGSEDRGGRGPGVEDDPRSGSASGDLEGRV